MKKEITFILNKSEITAGSRGSSLGPEAIISVARTRSNQLFSTYPLKLVPDSNHLLDHATEHIYAKRIDGLIKVYEHVSEMIAKELQSKRFPFVLAGDHGSAGGTIAGIKQAFPDKRLGVIWIDAHGDLHTPFTTPSGNLHGMPLATAINEDNLDCQINKVPEQTAIRWEKLKNVGFQGAKVLPKDIVYIAVRDVEKEEQYLINHHQITVISVDQVRRIGTNQTIQNVLDQLSGCDLIYISFDVDSMDPSMTSYGTGTPVDGGLSPEEARDLLNGFAQSPKLVCIELVEVNPCLDEQKNKMAEVAFELVNSLVSTLTY